MLYVHPLGNSHCIENSSVQICVLQSYTLKFTFTNSVANFVLSIILNFIGLYVVRRSAIHARLT